MEKLTAQISLLETFDTFTDASTWVEGHLRDWMDDPEMHLEQCSVNLINGKYRAGVVMTKRQGELDV